MDGVKTRINQLLAMTGFRLVRVGDPAAIYGAVLPVAQYRPWLADPVFRDTYDTIRAHTLVDEYRCWELWTLVRQLTALEAGAILEVGVWRGGTGALIAKSAALAGIADPIVLCDTFSGVVKAGARDTRYRGGEHADTSVAHVEQLFAAMQLSATILRGIFPDDTAHRLSASRLRFVHIDVDVYDSAKDIVCWAWPRVVPGGVIVFDDYGFKVCPGIAQLVNELFGPDRLLLHNLNGHAILVKR